jgi:hypothetical protein
MGDVKRSSDVRKGSFEGVGYRVERQVPINATALTGRLRVLKLLGRRNEEFVVAQYLLLAHPCQTA